MLTGEIWLAQEKTLDAGKITDTTFVLHDVLSDYKQHVLLKTLIKCFVTNETI